MLSLNPHFFTGATSVVFANSTFSDGDFGVAGIFLGKVQEFVGGMGLTIVLVGILAVLIGASISTNKKNKEESSKVA